MNNKAPHKAILLAAGFGKRIRPLSDDLPKPMMPIWGKPAVAHMADLMKRFGVRQILINLHHNPTPLLDYFRDNPVKGVSIEFSYEPEILGTGGALKKAAWFIENSPFWLANTDITAVVPKEPFLQEFYRTKPLAVLWLHPDSGPRTVDMLGNKIKCFRSKTPGKRSTYTFCGVQLVSPEILRYLPEMSFSSIIDAYSNAMNDGKRISGIVARNSFWHDIGTHDQYLQAHKLILENYRQNKPGAGLFDPAQLKLAGKLRRSGITINGFASIGKNVSIGRKSALNNSVIWDGATVCPKTSIDNAIIARNTEVHGELSGNAVSCSRIRNNSALQSALREIKWSPDKTTAIPLGARGSARSFTRLLHSSKSAIYIHYATSRAENAHYSEIARFLQRNGVPVPRILFDSPGICVTIMEDLGNCDLETKARTMSSAQLESCYRRVIDSLFKIHQIPAGSPQQNGITLQPPFTKELYKWERELFAEHFLNKQPGMKSDTIVGIMRDLKMIAGKLVKATPVLLHRDMQSSNILLRHGKPLFIDFQGMRLGPAAYDLASLLCDPYVMLSADLQDRLLDYYAYQSKRPVQIKKLFWFAAVERLAQALGAFGRLSSLNGARHFARHITPALNMMSRALSHINGLPHLKTLAESSSSLEK